MLAVGTPRRVGLEPGEQAGDDEPSRAAGDRRDRPDRGRWYERVLDLDRSPDAPSGPGDDADEFPDDPDAGPLRAWVHRMRTRLTVGSSERA